MIMLWCWSHIFGLRFQSCLPSKECNCGADNSVRRGTAERIQKAKKRSSLGLGVSRAISLQLENGLIIVLQLIP